MPAAAPAQSRPVIAWMQLVRLPNVFTAIADVSMGFLVADGSGSRLTVWAILIVATTAIYSAGMVLNDVFDYGIDQRERPQRPLPSGAIGRDTAKLVGGGLLLVGFVLGWVLHLVFGSAAPLQFQPGFIVTTLVLCVLAYNGLVKATVIGPLFMGACRFFNILLGVSVTQNPALFLESSPVMIAGAIGLYVVGITWFARYEAERSPRPVLFSGLILMLLGVAIVTVLPVQDAFPRERVVFPNAWAFPFLVWLATATVWRRAFTALYTTQPEAVQGTIKHALLTLIVLDAVIVLIVAGPTYAVGIILLTIPAAVLGRWIYVT